MQSFSRLFCDEVVAHKSLTLEVRARGLMVIHYSTWAQSTRINPVHEIKHLEKCEYFETEYQQVICFNTESESSICLLSSHILQ